MYADDRVLVAFVPQPTDFEIIQRKHWYRIPYVQAPIGITGEYIAFYFGKAFGDLKWAIHYYAQISGHELVRRIDILPDEPQHPRAQDIYYQLQLRAVTQLATPIVSLRWRRITFLHTTWDRFQAATEITDLVIRGGDYVSRPFTTLRESANREKKPSSDY